MKMYTTFIKKEIYFISLSIFVARVTSLGPILNCIEAKFGKKHHETSLNVNSNRFEVHTKMTSLGKTKYGKKGQNPTQTRRTSR